jgi:hypothetical protein
VAEFTGADFFDTGIQKRIARYKCLKSGDDYVEKELKYCDVLPESQNVGAD